MSASRKRPKGALRRPFGLLMSCVIMMPSSIGHQDLASLIARQPGVAERGRQHIRTVSTLSAMHTATFSFPRPLGSTIPDAPGYQLASLDPRALDVTGSIRRSDPFYDPFAERAAPPAPVYAFPTVERRLKGDLQVRRAPQPAPKGPRLKPRKTQEHAAPQLSTPATIPAVSQHEPFAIPQKLISEAERMHKRRVAAAEQAAREARAAMLAMRQPAPAEPFMIPQAEIVIAERMQAQRDTAARAAAVPVAEVQVERQDADADLLAAGAAEPFAVPEQDIAAAEQIAADRLAEASVSPDAQPEAVAADQQPAANADVAADPASQPDASEPLAISAELIAEAERIAAEGEAESETPAAVAAAPDDDGMIEAGAGIPVVENDQILTDEEPRDETMAEAAPAQPENPAVEMAKLYFGADSFGAEHGGLEAYAPGEAPTLLPSAKTDPDIKRSALPSPAAKAGDAPAGKSKEVPPAKDGEKVSEANTTIAAKGEVTGAGQRPRTPAERLKLTGASRAKQERCLANAIYFESRGEPERGQKAVAQVVMNRVFSPYYPASVCGVVYQNAHKHNACQFTFACDNVRDVVTEPQAWELAKRIARDTLDGKIWLEDIGKATHYHATYVNPWWVRTMKKHKTVGIHIFYRPKRWGDGSDEPTWDPAVVEATGSIAAPDKSRADAFDKPRG